MKTAVVYWSGTGNTETMANMAVDAITNTGASVDLFTASAFTPDMVEQYDAIVLGCPSMGAEVLEENEFSPMYESIKYSLANKKVGLFGSYGWGDGEWMRNWNEDCTSVNANVVVEPIMACGAPDSETQILFAQLAELLK